MGISIVAHLGVPVFSQMSKKQGRGTKNVVIRAVLKRGASGRGGGGRGSMGGGAVGEGRGALRGKNKSVENFPICLKESCQVSKWKRTSDTLGGGEGEAEKKESGGGITSISISWSDVSGKVRESYLRGRGKGNNRREEGVERSSLDSSIVRDCCKTHSLHGDIFHESVLLTAKKSVKGGRGDD